MPTAPTFKPIKALQPEVLSIEADTDTKDKWLRQYERYYYQSKINETDKAIHTNTHFKVIKAQFNSRCT